MVGVRILDLATKLPEKIDCQKVFCKCLTGEKKSAFVTIKACSNVKRNKKRLLKQAKY